MEIELTSKQAEEAVGYLEAMTAAVKILGGAVGSDERWSTSEAYFENLGKLKNLIPLMGPTPADEGPYTPEM